MIVKLYYFFNVSSIFNKPNIPKDSKMLAKQILCSILFYSIAVSPSAEDPSLCSYTHNPYGNIPPTNWIQGLLTFMKICKENTLEATSLKRQQKVNIIIKYIQHINPEEFSTINSETGQALIHHFAPWHWNNDIIAALVDKGVNMTIQTVRPDKKPGFTIAHIVACMNQKKHSPLHTLAQPKNQKYFQNQSNQIPTTQHFLALFFNKYPFAALLRSGDNENRDCICWEILHQKDRFAVYNLLTPETIQSIHQTAEQQYKQGSITCIERDYLLQQIPQKHTQQNQHA